MNRMNDVAIRQVKVWWAIWFSFQVGLFFYYFLLVKPPEGPSRPSPTGSGWMVVLVPLALSAVCRWVLLPRAKNLQMAFVQFILGIAFAEAVCFFAIFLFPERLQVLFPLSVVGVFQFVPVYARRIMEREMSG